MIRVSRNKYPGIHRALAELDYDGGGTACTFYDVPEHYMKDPINMNHDLLALTDKEISIFVGGEEQEIAEMALRSTGLASANVLLNAHFDGEF